MCIVVAIGDSALSERGENRISAARLAGLRGAISALAAAARDHQLVLVCGPGPETITGDIGRSIARELHLALPGPAAVTVLTQTVIRGGGGNAEAGAVVDKDITAAIFAEAIGARRMVFLTDVDGVYRHWKSFAPELIARARTSEIDKAAFARESMAPKVDAACRFARNTGYPAFIGNVAHAERLIAGTGGTRIDP
jgi:carbamate kinase